MSSQSRARIDLRRMVSPVVKFCRGRNLSVGCLDNKDGFVVEKKPKRVAAAKSPGAKTPAGERSVVTNAHDSYPLRTVTRLTGLSADVIRAWEKRHGVVTPVRGPRGARLYSTRDVQHLRSLERVVSSGRAIGDVAKLSTQELDALVVPASSVAADQSNVAGNVIERALDAVRHFDSAALDRHLGDALMAMGSVEFVRSVVSPLLVEVGDLWNRGHVSIADEHMVSGTIRNLLSGLLRSRAPTNKPTVLLATPSGERHEFGLLIAALLVTDAGIGIFYLGVDLPAAEIASAATRCDADVVALGLANKDNRDLGGRPGSSNRN